ncbi:MAG: peptide ABC transporter substrate-binding protein [Spirochaetaceae bacterium]|nr:peptide ABC transporter substrate-binding protein [Spirochaetaceae bacterium]
MSSRAFALAATLSLALAALSPAAAAQPTSAAGTELVVAFNDLEPEFDPQHSIYSAEAQIFTGIYEGLFSYDPASLDPVKAACRSFSRSKDGLTYTFYLREEARWSDGSPLLAGDFAAAWLRALDPAARADYAAFFDVIAGAKDYRLGKAKDPSGVGVSVVGDKVLQVKLAAPAAYFTRLLCHHSFSPVHPSMLKRRDWKATPALPVNGPYKVASQAKGEILLERNPHYWDAKAVRIDRVRLVLSDDDADVTRRYDNGEIQWLAGPMDLDALLDRGSIQVAPMFGTHYWFFDCGKAPWQNADLRRALALLLPWKELRSKENYVIPAKTLVLPFEGYDKVEGIAALDEEAARQLLAKAGHPDGKGLPSLTLLVPSEGEDAQRVAAAMKAAWERLPGLAVEIKKVPSANYFSVVRSGPDKGGFDLAITTWIGDFADPLAFLGMWTSDSNLNDARHADPEYDRLVAESAGKDGDERLAALAKAEARLLAGAAVLPMYHSIAVNVVDAEFLEGWFSNALDIHPFKYLGFGERRVRPNVASADPTPEAAAPL